MTAVCQFIGGHGTHERGEERGLEDEEPIPRGSHPDAVPEVSSGFWAVSAQWELSLGQGLGAAPE